MIRDVSEYTNVKISNMLVEHPQWTDSCRYPHIKETTPDEVRSFFGLMYIRAVLRQNLLSVKRVYYISTVIPSSRQQCPKINLSF